MVLGQFDSAPVLCDNEVTVIMELKMNDQTYIKKVSRVVTAQAGQCCSCKFPLEDEYGKYQGYEPHDKWELWHQDHDNSNFEYYLKCLGCGYELAKQYWKDLDGTFVDYTDGVADGFWKCPTVDSRNFPKRLTEREELEEQHGQVWNTKELQKDFTVQGFASPCVLVIRKSDGVKGTLKFIHHPRFYFDFVEGDH